MRSYLLTISALMSVTWAVLRPLATGLFNTSLWAAKVIEPAEVPGGPSQRLQLRFAQAALMEGWLSNVPLFCSILWYASIIFGFLYAWWAGVGAYIVCSLLGYVSRSLFQKPAVYYLVLIQHKMINRISDYKAKGDADRADAASSVSVDIARVIEIYRGSRALPPSPKQTAKIEYGDMFGLLNLANQEHNSLSASQ